MKERSRNLDFYYAERDKRTTYAAEKVMNIISEYVNPSSVVDLGGGVGTWTRCAAERFGIEEEDTLLIENKSVEEFLTIPKDSFKPWDLEKRVKLERRYDLVISLEVAEHLSEERAYSFIEDIAEISDMVLFSAAIPFQGGKGHINERTLKYWIDLFGEKDYEAFDIIRPLIQYDNKVDYWYKQNIVFFVKRDTAEYKSVVNNYKPLPPLSMVSYDLYTYYIRKPFKYPFYSLYQKLRKRDIYESWIKTKGAMDMR